MPRVARAASAKNKENGDGRTSIDLTGAEKQLNEIRSLLFSETVQDLRKEMTRNFSEHDKRIEKLSALHQKTTEQLKQQIKDQVKRINDALKKQNKDLLNSESQLKNELDNLHDQVEQNRDWVAAEHENIYGEIAEKYEASMAKLEAVANELIDNKVERRSLAQMFSNIASSLDPELAKNDNNSKSKRK
ncbi:hypothetical protein FLL45_04830 [Aliikangiella marina]|uniref:Uncharacterized protein n=1 Tax=Aliikangiella marina TaxID=1712262 RepID=A0A545TJ93_9GAMM|nr:hypothetical protein [Aliikangiella marina]TQV77273.1 hypothetical protein FLL45_04830 [Aliikangiella marina]